MDPGAQNEDRFGSHFFGQIQTLFKIGLKCDRKLEQKTVRFWVPFLGTKTGAQNWDQKFEVEY